MKNMRVEMTRTDLENIPQYSLPPGFRLRLFEKDEREAWARVETRAEEFENIDQALERFDREFGPHLDDFAKRCLFLENEKGEVIGTTTGWYGALDEGGPVIGRIHWVSIVPEYQGKGLAKPLMTGAMNILKKYHSAAYLTSYTINYKALNMYHQYGFQPVIRDAADAEAWEIVAEKLNEK